MKTLILILTVSLVLANSQDDPGFKSYMKGYEYVLNGNWDESTNQFEELIKQYPKSEYVDDAAFWIAYSKKEQNQNEDAIKLFTEFINKYPKSNHIGNANRNTRALARTLVKSGKSQYSKYMSIGRSDVTVSVNVPELAKLEVLSEAQTAELAEKMAVLSKQITEIAPVDGVPQVAWSISDEDEDNEEIKLQKQAVSAIYNMKNDAAKSDLKRIMSSKKALSVRKDALYYYTKLEKNIAGLIDLYSQLKEKRLKKELIYSISKKNSNNGLISDEAKQIEDFMMSVIESNESDDDLKKEAIYRLRYVTDERAYDVYTKLINTVQSSSLKKEIIYSISKTKSAKKNQFMLNTAKNPKEEMDVRKSAIYYLGKSIDSFKEMKSLYAGLQDKNLKKEMIYSFYKLNSDESIDFLIQLLKIKNTDIDVRKNIIYYLGKSKNPKGQKAIRDILFE